MAKVRKLRRLSDRPSGYQHKTISPKRIKPTIQLAAKKARKQRQKGG